MRSHHSHEVASLTCLVRRCRLIAISVGYWLSLPRATRDCSPSRLSHILACALLELHPYIWSYILMHACFTHMHEWGLRVMSYKWAWVVPKICVRVMSRTCMSMSHQYAPVMSHIAHAAARCFGAMLRRIVCAEATARAGPNASGHTMGSPIYGQIHHPTWCRYIMHITLCKGTPYIGLGTLPYLGAPPQFFADRLGATRMTRGASAPRRRAPGTAVWKRRSSGWPERRLSSQIGQPLENCAFKNMSKYMALRKYTAIPLRIHGHRIAHVLEWCS